MILTVNSRPASSVDDKSSWIADAACIGTDPEMFYPGKQGHPYFAARKLCAGCPVKSECLEFALVAEGTMGADYRGGMFGGLTPDERHALTKERAA